MMARATSRTPGVHGSDIGHVDVTRIVSVTSEDVNNGGGVDGLQFLDGRGVEDVFRGWFDDGQGVGAPGGC